MTINWCTCGGFPIFFQNGMYWVASCTNCDRVVISDDEYDVIEEWNDDLYR